MYRYAFRHVLTGHKFVNSGVYQRLKVGDVIWLRGTVKAADDKYGYTRLSRIRKVDKPQPELDL